MGSWVSEAVVADLYAGSGAFGLEALSRGAESVVIVENGRKALIALRSNIASVALGGSVVDATVQSFLNRSDDRFHIVFMDPPWDQDTGIMERDLTTLDRFLLPNAEVVVSRRHTDRIPDVPENWRVATNKRYGDTRILRYEKVESSE